MGARAFGRSLKDFWLDDGGRLHPAEQKLLEASARGDWCELDLRLPEGPGPDNFVRAEFVRFLALGGDDDAPVHETGVGLAGAWIGGALNIEAAEVPHPLYLLRTRIGRIVARDARLRGLYLNASCIEADFYGDGIKATGDVFLSEGFRAAGEVRLAGAEIGGDLVCIDARFEHPGGALLCDRIKVTGGVFLREGFRAEGAVGLPGAEIGGNLDCSGAALTNAGGAVLNGEGMKVTGDVLLCNGFRAQGEVQLPGAEIGGKLDCSGGSFENGDGVALRCSRATVARNMYLSDGFRALGQVRLSGIRISGDLDCRGGAFRSDAGSALFLASAHVASEFFFRSVRPYDRMQRARDGQAVDISGTGRINLSSCHVGTLVDDAESWDGAKGRLVLDGFTYGRIGGDPPVTDMRKRVAWLKSQRADLLGDEFRPQPWEQLIKVLREMGHPDEARRVAIAKQDALRAAGRIKRNTRPFHWLYGRLVGYGYCIDRLGWWLPALLVAGSLIFWAGARPDRPFERGHYWIQPAAARPDIDCLARLGPDATADDQKKCPARPPAMNEFFAPAYALDALLPIINLGYKAEWRPNRTAGDGTPLIGGWAVQAMLWLLTIFGWVAGALIAVAVGGLVRKD